MNSERDNKSNLESLISSIDDQNSPLEVSKEDDYEISDIYEKIQNNEVSRKRLEEFVSYLKVKKNKFDEGELLRVFEKLDIDKDNKISSDEIKKFLHSMRNPINKYYIEKMIGEFDKNKDGNIGDREFIDMMNAQKDKENNRDMKEIIEIFKIFDTNHDNIIGHEDLYHVMKALGENFTDVQCQNMIQLLVKDQNKKGIKKDSINKESMEYVEGINFARFFELIKDFADA